MSMRAGWGYRASPNSTIAVCACAKKCTPQLQGDQFDATMNYRGFSIPLQQWLAGFDVSLAWRPGLQDPDMLPTEALADQCRAFIAAIPWQIAAQQFNLLGSHDTPRIQTVVGEDETLARIAAALLFTFPGTPSVYYGDRSEEH